MSKDLHAFRVMVSFDAMQAGEVFQADAGEVRIQALQDMGLIRELKSDGVVLGPVSVEPTVLAVDTSGDTTTVLGVMSVASPRRTRRSRKVDPGGETDSESA